MPAHRGTLARLASLRPGPLGKAPFDGPLGGVPQDLSICQVSIQALAAEVLRMPISTLAIFQPTGVPWGVQELERVAGSLLAARHPRITSKPVPPQIIESGHSLRMPILW